MWDKAVVFLQSPSTWAAAGYLIAGAIIGALISVHYSLRARKPRLIVGGGGGGGNQERQSWRINITNRPSFFGQPLDGEPAKDVHAHIRLNEPKSASYTVYWDPDGQQRTTIEPGHNVGLSLFHWRKGEDGYCVVDAHGEPVARFQDRDLEFLLTMHDRLSRKTELKFSVEFDDSHLQNTPRLTIRHPISLGQRVHMVRSGLRQTLAAFKRH